MEEGVSGILVEPKNVSHLSDKMELLLINSDLRNSLAKAGRIRAELYFDRPVMLQNQVEAMNAIVKK